MGYRSAKLAAAQAEEKARLEKKAKKRGLFGSIGRLVGSFLPALIPGLGWAGKAAFSGLGSLFGGAAATAGVKIPGGRFYKSSRKSIEKETDPFGAENITGALTTAVTAGLGAKLGDLVGIGGGEVVTDPTTGAKTVVGGKLPGFFKKEAWIADPEAFEKGRLGKVLGYESPATKWAKTTDLAFQEAEELVKRTGRFTPPERPRVPIASEEIVDKPLSDLGSIEEPGFTKLGDQLLPDLSQSPDWRQVEPTQLSAQELGLGSQEAELFGKIDIDPYASSYGQTDAEFLGLYSDQELKDLYTSPHSRSLLAQESGFGGGQFAKDQPMGQTYGRFANPPGGVRQSTLDLLRGGDPNSLLNQWRRR